MIILDDVKDQSTEALPQAEETADQTSQPDEQTQNTEATPSVETQPERTVPIKVLQEERKRRQELQRQLAERETNQNLSQYDPEDVDAILQHPMVQELIIKQARQELTDYARDALDKYPTIPELVKKAILKNVRGFVNETTSDVETAKIDLSEYIESIADEAGAQPTELPSKGFKVANTNVPSTVNAGIKPAEIQNILGKPIDSWTPEEEATVAEYQQRNSK